LPYGQPGGVAIRVANRRVQYTALHCSERDGTDSAPIAPTRTDGEATAKRKLYVHARRASVVQWVDHLFVAAVEAAYMHRRPWSSPDPGATWDRRAYLGSRARVAGSPRIVSPLNEYPNPDPGMHAIRVSATCNMKCEYVEAKK